MGNKSSTKQKNQVNDGNVGESNHLRVLIIGLDASGKTSLVYFHVRYVFFRF